MAYMKKKNNDRIKNREEDENGKERRRIMKRKCYEKRFPWCFAFQSMKKVSERKKVTRRVQRTPVFFYPDYSAQFLDSINESRKSR